MIHIIVTFIDTEESLNKYSLPNILPPSHRIRLRGDGQYVLGEEKADEVVSQ